jgi:hypothetical protein
MMVGSRILQYEAHGTRFGLGGLEDVDGISWLKICPRLTCYLGRVGCASCLLPSLVSLAAFPVIQT